MLWYIWGEEGRGRGTEEGGGEGRARPGTMSISTLFLFPRLLPQTTEPEMASLGGRKRNVQVKCAYGYSASVERVAFCLVSRILDMSYKRCLAPHTARTSASFHEAQERGCQLATRCIVVASAVMAWLALLSWRGGLAGWAAERGKEGTGTGKGRLGQGKSDERDMGGNLLVQVAKLVVRKVDFWP